MPDDRTTIYLDESRVPLHWYNVVADLPPPPPPLHPVTTCRSVPTISHRPRLILQEVATDRHVDIPPAATS
jgi:tryptophan synthase beta chain